MVAKLAYKLVLRMVANLDVMMAIVTVDLMDEKKVETMV
jgi:hypothetical protein